MLTTWERFLQHVDAPDGAACWRWTGSTVTRGYGTFYMDGKMTTAHRAAWELMVGPIPPAHQPDHLCRNRSCVNPAHLQPVTSRENTLRGEGPSAKAAVATHCKHGHEFTEENTALLRGYRVCRACERRKWHEKEERRRAREASRG